MHGPGGVTTGVSATESGDQFNVSWAPAAATAPYISQNCQPAAVLIERESGGKT